VYLHGDDYKARQVLKDALDKFRELLAAES
jgi:hypothetical protein